MKWDWINFWDWMKAEINAAASVTFQFRAQFQQLNLFPFQKWIPCAKTPFISEIKFKLEWPGMKLLWLRVYLFFGNHFSLHQPSTCLISTYVCFLSIDILTVIIFRKQSTKLLFKSLDWCFLQKLALMISAIWLIGFNLFH